MTLMGQNLTNQILSKVHYVLLADYSDSIKGIENNGIQFYHEISQVKLDTLPNLYRRRKGILDLNTLERLCLVTETKINRTLPAAIVTFTLEGVFL